ncbi:MAG TPA: M20/M25/M40 family metallo-hydrolase [Gemmatimonadales bacterium]|jgi:hypothetical protein|nr:M20/M25/M40 family metallo-hydrolase [Gemmatimonadales bacterium]
MVRKLLVPLFLAFSTTALAGQAPEKIDTAMNAKIRTEGMDHSKIMWIEHFFTDVYGPRPVGSPNHKAAAEWALKTMASWGMVNTHLEPFTWRGVGWMPGKASGYISSPYKSNVKFEANPWSPSIKGTISGPVVVVVAPENPTEAQLTAYLTSMAPKVKGGIVMVGPIAIAPVNFCPTATRISDSAAKASYAPRPAGDTAAAGGRGGRRGGGGGGGGADCGGGRGGGGGGRRGAGAPAEATPAGIVAAGVVNQRIQTLVRDNMPGLLLKGQGPGRIPGEIVAQNGQGQIYNDTTPQPPSVILRNDDYGRIFRVSQDGTPVIAEFSMQNQYFPSDTSYVTVGEIPGTDKKDEVVMMGGHLDSWASATGATDNAIGSAIMMEAARIIEAIGAKPRRTIRVALWSGEEEGELGSDAYVANHFGTAEAPKPEFSKLDAYWNIDDGTGLFHGGTIFGPPAAAAILGQYFNAWSDWGVYGASASTARSSGSTDSGPFDVAGLPGVNARQDPIEYQSVTWHSDLDTYERIIPDDVMKSATVTASVMLGLANRDEMLPRFAADKMPAIPPPGGNRGGAGRGVAAGAGATAPTGPTATPHVYAVTKGLPLRVKTPGLAQGGGGGRGGAGGAGRGAAGAETAAVATKPAHGTLLLRPDGSFTYTPSPAYVGTDSFTYKVTRGGETSPEAMVTIVVR